MNLDLTQEQKLLQQTVREFAECRSEAAGAGDDETGHFPRETFRKAAELGLTACRSRNNTAAQASTTLPTAL